MSHENVLNNADQETEIATKPQYEKPVLHILSTSETRNAVAGGSDGTLGS